MKEIDLQLRARHFLNAEFDSCATCAIAQAAREQFETLLCLEGVNELYVDGKRYRHNRYDVDRFRMDEDHAEMLKYDDTILRTIKLVEV